MHIIFVTHDIDSGGSARSLSILVQELVKRHTVQIITFLPPEPGKQLELLYRQLGVPLYLFQWGWLPVSFVGCPQYLETNEKNRKYLPELEQFAKNADIICFNSYAPSSLAPYFPEKPRVLIAREVIDENSPQYQASISMLRRYISMAIAIGPQEARQLETIGIPHEIVFNTATHQPHFYTHPAYPPIRFGMFAQFTRSKGMDILLYACAEQVELLKQYNVHIHLFGIDFHSELKSMELIKSFIHSNGLEDHIHIEGWVNNVEEAMINMHCIIRPDRTGSPWGRDIIEAMSLGRSVIASGEEDVFIKNGETGYLFPTENAEVLGKIIASIVKYPKIFEKMGYNAFLFAKEHFNIFMNVQKIEYILQNVINNKV